MKPGAENRKKTVIAGALGMVALICVVFVYNTLFGGSSTPAPTAPPVITSAPANKAIASSSGNAEGSSTLAANAPGVAAVKMATTSSSLDPTLDETAMLRTESLVYSGTGRNIFSATYTPPPAEIKKPIVSVRPGPIVAPPPPPPSGPPPPPPINLKFFGTAKRGNGKVQAFLLQGEDVYLAAEGDIVARKYKIVSISNASVRVTDLQNNNTQTLPLQMN
jgi:hypothetical protein